MNSRVEKVTKQFEELGIDCLLITNKYNIMYLSEFVGTNAYILVLKDKSIFITDFRYSEQARKRCSGFEIVIQTKSIYETVFDLVKELKVKRLGFEQAQVTYKQFDQYKKCLKNIKLIPVDNAVEKIRRIKDENEILRIHEAMRITDKAFSHILDYIKPGVREIDIALEIEFFMRQNGASALSFDTIVASGLRSSMPHGIASDKLIESGDAVTLDFGCIYKGYCSDMTRTVFVGKADEKLRQIYEIVLNAQKSSLEILKPGLIAREADAAARNLISSNGFGENFGHSLGHSVGLEIHEEPNLSSKSESILDSGNVVAVEPGIYVDGIGGVRIEDLVVINEEGHKNLTTSSKEIIVL